MGYGYYGFRMTRPSLKEEEEEEEEEEKERTDPVRETYPSSVRVGD
jgi:hypothetical protein